MKRYKCLSYVFIGLAVLLSDMMCATVAYEYCNMRWSIQYTLTSAPASVAFAFIIPYGVGIVICATLAWFFHKRCRFY